MASTLLRTGRDSVTPLPRVLHIHIAACLPASEVVGLRCVHRVLARAADDPLAFVHSVVWTPQSVDELRSVLLCSTNADTDDDAVPAPAAAASSSLNPSWLWPAAAIRASESKQSSQNCRAVLAKLSRVSLDRCYGLSDSDICTLLPLCTALRELTMGNQASQAVTPALDFVSLSPTCLSTLSLSSRFTVGKSDPDVIGWSTAVTVSDIAAFSPSLEVCELHGFGDEETLQHLSRLPLLRKLLISFGELPEGYLSPEHFPSLTELDLPHTCGSDELLALCSRLPLRSLSISDCLDGGDSCPPVLEQTLTSLLSASSACHATLESLRLGWMCEMPLTAFFLLAAALPRLTTLVVGAAAVTTSVDRGTLDAADELLHAVRAFLASKAGTLETLDLSHQIDLADNDGLVNVLALECPALTRLSAVVSIKADKSPFSVPADMSQRSGASNDSLSSQLRSLKLRLPYSVKTLAPLSARDLLHPLFSSLEELTLSAHRLTLVNAPSSSSSSSSSASSSSVQRAILPQLRTLRLLTSFQGGEVGSPSAAEVSMWASVAPNVRWLMLKVRGHYGSPTTAPELYATAAVSGFHSLTTLSLIGFCFGADSTHFWRTLAASTTLVKLSIKEPHYDDQLNPRAVESALQVGLTETGVNCFSRLLFLTFKLPRDARRYTYSDPIDPVTREYGRWHDSCQRIRWMRPNMFIKLRY